MNGGRGGSHDTSNTSGLLGSEASPRQTTTASNSKKKAKPWANLWKEKRQNNADYLLAAEEGNLQEMLDLLDQSKKML